MRKPLDWLSRSRRARRAFVCASHEGEEGASMRLGVAASAGTVWLLLKEGLSEFAFAVRSHEGSVPAGPSRATTALRGWGSCSSGSHDIAHAAMSSTAAKGLDNTSSESATAPPKKQPPVTATATATATAVGTARATGTEPAAKVARAADAVGAKAARPEGVEATEATPRFERGRSTIAVAGAGVGERGRDAPSVTLKLAMDRNGAVDDVAEGPKRFTSPESLDAVHRIRRDCGGVLVGVGTVVRDDPSLTVRRVPLNEGQTQQPTRVVLDRTLRLTAGKPPGQAKCAILRDGHSSVVFYSAGSEETDTRAVQLKADVERSESSASASHRASSAVDFVGLPARSPGAGVDLVTVLEALFERGIEHVLVEGGPGVARDFLSEGLVDRAVIVRAPMEFSHPVPSDISTDTLQRAGLEVIGCTRWGDDTVECWTRPGLNWPGGGVGSWP